MNVGYRILKPDIGSDMRREPSELVMQAQHDASFAGPASVLPIGLCPKGDALSIWQGHGGLLHVVVIVLTS